MNYLRALIFLLFLSLCQASDYPTYNSEEKEGLTQYHRIRHVETFLSNLSKSLNTQAKKSSDNLKQEFEKLEKKISESPQSDMKAINKLIEKTKEDITQTHQSDIQQLRDEIRNVDYKISQNFEATLKSLREDIFKLKKELEEQKKLIGTSKN